MHTQKSPQYSPYHHVQFKLQKRDEPQTVTITPDSLLLTPNEIKWIPSDIGSLSYYARTLDNTILPALNQLGTQ